jgi:hypothetical protein
MLRSGRFAVSEVGGGKEGSLHEQDDYLILEIRREDMRELKRQMEIALSIEDALEKDGRAPDKASLCCFELRGKPHPQRADRSDGTTSWPPSFLSVEVIAESGTPDRWK